MAKKLTEKEALVVFDNRLKSMCASALADPGVDEHAKSLAGYWLELISSAEKSSTEEVR